MKLVVIVLSFCSLLFLDVFGIRFSQKKCSDYRKMRPPTSAEFNESDEDAALKEFPFMARIESDTDYCNGILLSEYFVLTTATCGFTSGNDFVILGDIKENSYKDDAHMQRFDVIQKFVHPTTNIVLLQLNESVQFNEYILPACLSQSHSINSQQFVQIGWSSTNIRDNGLVHKVRMNYVANALCKQIYTYNNRTKYIRHIDNNGTNFCAGTKRGGRRMCGGFSGAALLRSNDRDNEIIGIASVGFGCVNSNPTIFIRVSAYIDWIESIVWHDNLSDKQLELDLRVRNSLIH